MKLYSKIFIIIIAIFSYAPFTASAGFVIKKADFSTLNTAQYGGYTENAVVHKKTFFGKIVQKFSGVEHVFTSAKKKWIAILLGLLDIFVLGGIGLPRFYLGYTAEGIMQLVFYLLGAVGIVCLILAFGLGNFALLIPAYLCIGLCIFSWIWQIVDVIRIMCNSLKPKEGYWD